MFEYEKVLEELKKLDSIGITLCLIDLLQSGKLQFPELVKLYVADLEQCNSKLWEINSKMALRYAMSLTKSEEDKEERRWLHSIGYFKGSKFGEELEKEFGNG